MEVSISNRCYGDNGPQILVGMFEKVSVLFNSAQTTHIQISKRKWWNLELRNIKFSSCFENKVSESSFQLWFLPTGEVIEPSDFSNTKLSRNQEPIFILNPVKIILMRHKFFSGGSSKCSTLLERNFVGNWFIALQCRTIHCYVMRSWGRKCMGKDISRNPRSLIPQEQWWFHS